MYLGVAPSLESNLRDQRLNSLAVAAQRYSPPIRRALESSSDVKVLDGRVRRAADSSGARVTLLAITRTEGGPQLEVRSDSTAEVDITDLRFGAAAEAVRTGRMALGTETGTHGRVAEAALPLRIRPRGSRRPRIFYVAVFSQPLVDVQGGVDLIRRRILVAGAIALALAVLAGWLIARALAQRVKRLEKAAEQVAAGDFSRPIPVDSDDELGQLAVAFNDMQRQLAQLDRARKQFIATASHELRTPLFSLGGFVELLEDEELDDETRRRFLAQVRQQVDRLAKLSVDLLDLSRLEAGSLELRPEPVDLAELARSVSSEF